MINRNNRLKKLLDLRAPEVIVRNEKRMLQEAVDALFDNGRRGRVIKGSNNRPLKSLSDNLKGKQGRFRQKPPRQTGRLLGPIGDRGRTGAQAAPVRTAEERWPSSSSSRLSTGSSRSGSWRPPSKMAKELVELQTPEVWDALEKVIEDHPVLLNRAPTLHRLGIQAF